MTTANPTKQTPADTIRAALGAQPGATASELADTAGIGRSTAAKALAVMEQEGTARRATGGRDGGRRLPDRWHPAGTTADPESDPFGDEESEDPSEMVERDGAAAASRHSDGAGTEPVEGGADRLGKGALRALVLDYLAAHAGADGLGPTAVAKGLGGKSSGAVGNALQRLEADGAVRLVNVAPRRYVTAD